SLKLKAVLPQPQTLPIGSAAGAAVALPVSTQGHITTPRPPVRASGRPSPTRPRSRVSRRRVQKPQARKAENNPAQRPAPKRAVHAAGTVRGRPVTQLRTVGETAELFNTSIRSVRRFIASGALPVIRLGRSVRISDDDIAAFLAANRSD